MSFFDFLNPFGSLISGGLNLVGNYMQNSAAQERQAEANAFNADQANINRSFNAQQADIARVFSADQAQIGRSFVQDQSTLSREFNAGEAQRARDFAQTMSSTAYQRATQDMKNAGLNPILAYQQGSASSPTVGAASSSPASGPTASSSTASGVNTPSAQAAQVRNLMENVVSSSVALQRLKPEIENVEQDTKRKAEETRLAKNTANTQAVETEKRQVDYWKAVEEREIRAYQKQVAKREAQAGELDTKARETPVGDFARRWGTIMRDLNPLVGNAKTLHQMILGHD